MKLNLYTIYFKDGCRCCSGMDDAWVGVFTPYSPEEFLAALRMHLDFESLPADQMHRAVNYENVRVRQTVVEAVKKIEGNVLIVTHLYDYMEVVGGDLAGEQFDVFKLVYETLFPPKEKENEKRCC